MEYRGVVQRGERRGSELGFPTANIAFAGTESGIYAALCTLAGVQYDAAVYVDQRRKVLEAHLSGFSGGDLYGEEIVVELLKKIREDQSFTDEASLKEAIRKDVRAVGDYFDTKN